IRGVFGPAPRTHHVEASETLGTVSGGHMVAARRLKDSAGSRRGPPSPGTGRDYGTHTLAGAGGSAVHPKPDPSREALFLRLEFLLADIAPRVALPKDVERRVAWA